MGASRDGPDQGRVQEWLTDALAAAVGLNTAEIGPRERFSRYGLDSVRAVALAEELGRRLDQPVSPALFWEHPTVGALAAHLSGAPDRGPALPAGSVPGRSAAIAVIGMACRFPAARGIEEFRAVLRRGEEVVGEVPPDRWPPDLAIASGLLGNNDPSVRRGGFLTDPVDRFDAAFFGISPREAREMDPQQRLVLELAWEALEDAGIPPDSLEGTDTGVFSGVTWHDYAEAHRLGGAKLTPHTGAGQAFSVIANRVSYALGLRGPSLSLDTACSSSAVAVHLACRSIRSGESMMALAGGVNLMLAPSTTAALREFGGLSPEGRCRPFDAGAKGFVRGEGAGIVVLKALDRAIADGDRIYAAILGSAMNNDGASNGLTAPSREAQERVLRDAYRDAGVDPGDVAYVEAHGTGTLLGDPIEAAALGSVLGGGRASGRPLRIGSVKGCIGHLEGAAGVAGLIKTCLMLHHRELAPSVNHHRPNPHIDFEALGLEVQGELELWRRDGGPRRAGVSAFGWGGTNCHLVLEEHRSGALQLVRLAAEDQDGLRSRAEELGRRARAGGWPIPGEGLEAGPTPGPHRLAFVADSAVDLVEGIDAFLEERERPGMAQGVDPGDRGAPVFVYSPHGSQWIGMGRTLLHDEPAFRGMVQRLDAVVREEAGWSVIDQILADSTASELARVDVAQPMIACLQIALTELWREHGIRPRAVVGHSLGEVAAAHAAGILEPEDAARLICRYSRLQTRDECRGGMAVAALDPTGLAPYLAEVGEGVRVAGLNSPTSTLLTGDPDALDDLVARCREESVFAARVAVPVAAHGPRFDGLHEELVRRLRWLRPGPAKLPMVSTLTGRTVEGEECGDSYWARNMREPVRFWPAVEELVRKGHRTFVEVSPHPVLLRAVEETLEHLGVAGTVLPTLRRDEDRGAFLSSLAELWTAGAGAGPGPDAEPARRSRILPLSARSEDALEGLARDVLEVLRGRDRAVLDDVCRTAALHRTHHPHRLALVARTGSEMADRLEGFLDRRLGGGIRAGRRPPAGPPPRAFLFSGQGARWWDAARDLLVREPTFRSEMHRCARAVREVWNRDPIEELTAPPDGSGLDRTEVAQPTLFTVQVALAALWRSWGVEPDAVVGHSVGEVAAAHVAGALDLEDAARVITERSRVTAGAGAGRMVAVGLPRVEAERRIEAYEDRLFLAAVNGPSWSVLSGEGGAAEELVRKLAGEGVEARWLALDRAFHTPAMGEAARQLVASLAGISPRVPSVPIYSAVTGGEAEAGSFGSEYWGANLRQPVLFGPAVQGLLDAGVRHFVEIGPHPVLAAMIGDSARAHGTEAEAVVSLRRGQSGLETMLDGLATLYAGGGDVRWPAVVTDGRRTSRFPHYPWQRKRYWFGRRRGTMGIPPPGGAEGEWPGRRLPTAVPTFECSLEALGPFVRDHRVAGVPVLPASGFLALGRAAVERVLGAGEYVVEDLVIRGPLASPEGVPRNVQVSLHDVDTEGATFRIHSAPATEGDTGLTWSLHATGRVQAGGIPSGPASTVDPRERSGGVGEIDEEGFYRILADQGLEFGVAFRTVARLEPGAARAVGTVRAPSGGDRRAEEIGTLDGLLQCCLGLGSVGPGRGDPVHLVTRIDRISGPPPGRSAMADGPLRAVVTRREGNGTGASVVADVRGVDPGGEIRVEIRGVHLQRVSARSLEGLFRPESGGWCYRVAWEEEPLGANPSGQAEAGGEASPRPAEIVARLSETLGAAPPPGARARREEVRAALDALASTFAAGALLRLRPGLRPGDRIDEGAFELPAEAGPGRRRYIGRLLEIGAESGALEPEGDRWVVKKLPEDDAAEAAAALLGRIPEHRTEIELLARCGERLAEVLRGEEDPLALLHSAGAPVTAEALYRDAPSLREANARVAGAVAAAIGARPVRRPLRVLEIGAGTGATTEAVLERLPPQTDEYLFTDVSEGLVRRAEERLVHLHPSLRFATLDIEEEPAGGPDSGRFDVVVAANVMHATRDVGRALEHARRFLAPRGLLVVLETTGVRRWVDLVFGMTDGWWRFADPARPAHPLLAAPRWVSLLEESGFTDATCLEGRDGEDPVLPQSVLLARAPDRERSGTTAIDRPATRPAGADAGPPGPGAWLLLTRGSEFGREVARRLEAVGDRCIRVGPGDRFRAPDSGAWRVRRGVVEDYERLAREAARRSGVPLRGAVHLWAAEAGDERPSGGDLVGALSRESLEPLLLAQTLEGVPGARLWVVTAGAQPAAGTLEPLSPFQAPLWGFGRSVALRHGGAWGGLVDLPPGPPDPEHAERLVAELRAPDREDQVAFRDDRRLLPRLRPAGDPEPLPFQAASDATYLVTGGLGGVGRRVARWLVERGAGRVVLVGRSGLPPRESWSSLDGELADRARAVREMEERGARVDVATADVGDRDAVTDLIERLRAGESPLRGIVHAAADLRPRPLSDLDLASVRSMFGPKVAGAWWLHQESRELDLDFFVLFSSTTALLGAPDLAHYAAANQFLGALAHRRAEEGLPALTVDWGTWETMGALPEEARETALRSGQNAMAAERALGMLGRLLAQRPVASGGPQVAVADIDWDVLRPIWESRRRSRFLEGLEARPARSPKGDRDPGGVDSLPGRLADAPEGARREIIADFVEKEVRGVLGLSAGEPLDPEVGFFELGMDSLMSVQLKDRIEAGVGRPLPGTLTLNHPNVQAVSRYLADLLEREGATRPARAAGDRRDGADPGPAGADAGHRSTWSETEVPAAREDDPLLAEVEEMSEEEVRRSLVDEVAGVESDSDREEDL